MSKAEAASLPMPVSEAPVGAAWRSTGRSKLLSTWLLRVVAARVSGGWRWASDGGRWVDDGGKWVNDSMTKWTI